MPKFQWNSFWAPLRVTILCGILGSLLGCGPQGDTKTNVQAPHQAFLDRQNPVKTNLANTRGSGGEPGLPQGCNFSRASKSKLCLTCKSDDWLVTRCYASSVDLDETRACQHTSETIKCLMDNPPFALALGYRASHEKFLRDNYKLWQQTIHSVWDDKLNPEERTMLNGLLAFLDQTSLWLSKSPAEIPTDEELNAALIYLGPTADKNPGDVRTLLREMQNLRLDSKLQFVQLLLKTEALLDRIHASPKAREIVKSLNTQGLDE